MAIVHTATAIPAFFGMQDNWRFTFPGIRDVNIYLTVFDALVASVTYFRIKNYRGTGG